MRILSLLVGGAAVGHAHNANYEAAQEVGTYQVKTALTVLRFKRMNSGFFEETRDDNFQRECKEEMCSKEELTEIFGDPADVKKHWYEFTRQCYTNKCSAQGTTVCIQEWGKRQCKCK